MPHLETTAEVLRKRGFSRRDFVKFCALTAVSLGLGPGAEVAIAQALSTKPRMPVIWLSGLSCSCCTESFLRTAHPLATDIILSLIALDCVDLVMAAAGDQAEDAFNEAVSRYKGQYILALEGNAPLHADGMYCIDGGKPFLDKLRRGVENARALVAWGTCASWGCVQAASPNPTGATPLHKLFPNKPQLKVPGCPPIPDVMSAVIAYIVTFDRLPELDAQGRPLAFYGKRVHDQCYRRAHFDAGEYVESWDDEGARQGLCLYKMGCKGPTTYNACPATRWNNGVSFPIESGHGCIGCSEQNFWDQGSFYDRITTIPHFGTNATAETVGVAAVAAVAGGVAVHGVASMIRHARCPEADNTPPCDGEAHDACAPVVPVVKTDTTAAPGAEAPRASAVVAGKTPGSATVLPVKESDGHSPLVGDASTTHNDSNR